MANEARVATFHSSLFTVAHEGPVVIASRTQLTLGAGRSLDQALTQLRIEVQRAASASKARGLVLDFRRAVTRNDPEFEAAFARARPLIAQGMPRLSFLMATPLGKLQAQRYARDDAQGAQAFLNEKLAIAFARPPAS
jgi:hypothetical protein